MPAKPTLKLLLRHSNGYDAIPYTTIQTGGGRWIRTTEAFASDLQSDPFGRSGIPPKFLIKFL